MSTHATSRGRCACLAATMALCTVLARAQQPQKTVVRLSVNQVEKGDVIVLLSPGDVLIRVTDLAESGLSGFSGERQTVAGDLYVSLASLAPAATYKVNEKELTLEISARNDLLGRKVLDLRSPRPEGIEYTRNTTGFLNYALTERTGAPFSVVGEAGISLGGPLLLSNFSQVGGRFIRGSSSLTFDERDRLRRWTIGDTPANSVSALTAGLPLLGIGVSRNFNLDPYFIRLPSLGISATVDTPSTLEVYLNGRLIHQEQVPPGQIDLRNLPAVQGNGSVRLVIRDAFGREREIVSPYYLGSRILARATSEYTYNLGLVRTQTASATASYGPLAFLASHRRGMSDKLTAGFHIEALGGLFNAGPSIAARLPRGEFEISTAASTRYGKPGATASLSYSYVGHRFGFGLLARARSVSSPSFDLTLRGAPPLADTNVFVSIPYRSRATFSLQYGASRLPGAQWTKTLSVIGSVRVASRMSLTFSARSSLGSSQPGESVSVGLNYTIGKRTIANAGLQLDGSSIGSNLQVAQSLPPVGNGFGYRVLGQTGPSNQFSGLFQYQGPYGRYEADYTNIARKQAASFTVSGSITDVAGRVRFAQPVQESFGLLHLPGLPGVTGYLENLEVGRTDSRGDLFIPTLQPYYGNRVKIDAEQIPVNSDIGITEKLVAPPYRGGAVISFPVQRVQAITGKLVVQVDGKDVVPAYGDLAVIVAGKRVVSPVGMQGQFYFENLPPGRHVAKIEGGEQECQFTLTVSSSNKPFLDLGTLRCVAEPGH
jgi:outer membrane usher protein